MVTSVDARHITVKYDSGEVKDYKLTKFLRSNHGTCINQRPIVEVGERVHGWGTDENGQTVDPTVLADGPATEQGEIALGQNILVGFMTWEGYNYEDAVLLNERLVGRTCIPPSTSKSTRSTPGTPSWARRRSQETSPMWARTP